MSDKMKRLPGEQLTLLTAENRFSVCKFHLLASTEDAWSLAVSFLCFSSSMMFSFYRLLYFTYFA